MPPTFSTAVIACSTLWLAGCMATGNNRVEIGMHGQQLALPDVGGIQDRAEHPLRSDGPTLNGLNRSNWRPTAVLVPVDGLAAYPTYAHALHWAQSTSRQRGGPVTPLSALEQEGDTAWLRVWEAAAAPWLACYDTVALPVRIYNRAPWREAALLPRSYWRTTPGVATRTAEPAQGEP